MVKKKGPLSTKYWSIVAWSAQGRDYLELFVHFFTATSRVCENTEAYFP